ncbi:MAG TPA: hypothetical protein DEW46_10885 [Verrucomicrobia bacterium]|jgi:hypothetical protein|nr:hypothetical protein [Verrucomicrobiota bacterium]
MRAFSGGISHRGHRVHRENLRFAIDERVLLQPGCGRTRAEAQRRRGGDGEDRLGMRAFSDGISHRGHRVHREILRFAIDETALFQPGCGRLSGWGSDPENSEGGLLWSPP